MNTHTKRLLPIAVVIGLLIIALGPRSGNAAIQSQCPTLTPQVSDRIWFMSASQDERHKLMDMAQGYNLGMIFVKKNGEYVSNVEVTIRDRYRRNFVKTESCGPWFAAKVPDGYYVVTINYEGTEYTWQPNTVGGEHARFMFHLPG
jgi:hypothetical protein